MTRQTLQTIGLPYGEFCQRKDIVEMCFDRSGHAGKCKTFGEAILHAAREQNAGCVHTGDPASSRGLQAVEHSLCRMKPELEEP